MNNTIDSLIKKYVLWPELNNDFQKKIHFGQVKMKDFMTEVRPLLNYQKPIETDIACFYLGNEKLSQGRIESQEVLGLSQLQDYRAYQETLNLLSKELLTYIVVCCVVEGRHIHYENLNPSWDDYLSSLPNKIDDNNEAQIKFNESRLHQKLIYIHQHPESQNFIYGMHESYRHNFTSEQDFHDFANFSFSVAHDVRFLLNKGHYEEDGDGRNTNMRNLGYKHVAKKFVQLQLENYTIEKLLHYLVILFSDDYKFEDGYGGSAWANIAKHGLQFVQGKMNTEIFVDQAFSLEHNNGNMFNKDFIFDKSKTTKLWFALYAEEQEDTSYTINSVPLNQILLNAQHLGFISNLFTIDHTLLHLKKFSAEEMYARLENDGLFQDFGPHYNFALFCDHYKAITKNYENLSNSLQPIKKYIKEYLPHLINTNEHNYMDFKSLFYHVGKHDIESLYDLSHSANPKNNNRFFVLWDKIHNHYLNPTYQKINKNKFIFKLYDFNNMPDSAFNKDIIGSKAYGLVNMKRLGFPVPKGKVFSTQCSHSFKDNEVLFKEFLHKILPSLSLYLQDMNLNPILCSIRSGAAISMPGMMDTVLNIGVDDSNYDYFCQKMGKKVVDNSINKFMQLFCSASFHLKLDFSDSLNNNLKTFKSVLNDHNIVVSHDNTFPLSKLEQIEYSLYAVFKSWYSDRAIAYRNEKAIDHNMGTAAIIQEMVFGNVNDKSCTGVVFSRNCLTGDNELVGEFLPKAQGEDIVSGALTPFDIDQLKVFNKEVYHQLNTIAKQLEIQTGQIQDIEFTVEDGKLYILQHRQAVCSPVALVKMLDDCSLNKTSLLNQIEPKILQSNFTVTTQELPLATGISANNGVLQGLIVQSGQDMIDFYPHYQEKLKDNPDFGWIFYNELTSPEHMPIMNKTHAFITGQGGFTCHAAIIARSLNKPCIVGLNTNNTDAQLFKSGDIITLDGLSGKIWKGQLPITKNSHLIKQFANIILDNHHIDLQDIDKKSLYQHINTINNQNKSWMFKFPQAYYCDKKIIKKQQFLDLSSKLALFITAERKNQDKLKIKN